MLSSLVAILILSFNVSAKESHTIYENSIYPKSIRAIKTCCGLSDDVSIANLSNFACKDTKGAKCISREIMKNKRKLIKKLNLDIAREIPVASRRSALQACKSKSLTCLPNWFAKNIDPKKYSDPKPNIKRIKSLFSDYFVGMLTANSLRIYCHLSNGSAKLTNDGKNVVYEKKVPMCDNNFPSKEKYDFFTTKFNPYVKSDKSGNESLFPGASGGAGVDKVSSFNQLFNASSGFGGFAQKITCPNFIPRVHCPDLKSPYNPLKYSTKRNLIFWEPKYTPHAKFKLGKNVNLGSFLKKIHKVVEPDFKKQLSQHVIDLYLEQYLETALVNLGPEKALEKYKIFDSLPCFVHKSGMLKKRAAEILKKLPGGVKPVAEKRQKEAALAGLCMNSISNRLAKLQHLFAQDVQVVHHLKTELMNEAKQGGVLAHAGATVLTNIPILKYFTELTVLHFGEAGKRPCGPVMLGGGGGDAGKTWGYIDPHNPTKVLNQRPKDGWNTPQYCKTAWAELKDLTNELGVIYRAYPELGEIKDGKPLFKKLAELAGKNDPANKKVSGYNRDYHFAKNASKKSCLSNLVEEDKKKKGKMNLIFEPSAKSLDFLKAEGNDEYVEKHLAGLQSQILNICADPEKFADQAVKNPIVMSKFFNCARVRFLSYANLTEAKKKHVKKSRGTLGSTCNERKSMAWLACRTFKSVKEDEGIQQALNASLMATSELFDYVGLGGATVGKLSFKAGASLAGGAFGGVLGALMSPSRESLINNEKVRQNEARIGLRAYNEMEDAAKKIVKIEGNPDPVAVAVISGVLGGIFSPVQTKIKSPDDIIKDSLATRWDKLWTYSKDEVFSSITERASKVNELRKRVSSKEFWKDLKSKLGNKMSIEEAKRLAQNILEVQTNFIDGLKSRANNFFKNDKKAILANMEGQAKENLQTLLKLRKKNKVKIVTIDSQGNKIEILGKVKKKKKGVTEIEYFDAQGEKRTMKLDTNRPEKLAGMVVSKVKKGSDDFVDMKVQDKEIRATAKYKPKADDPFLTVKGNKDDIADISTKLEKGKKLSKDEEAYLLQEAISITRTQFLSSFSKETVKKCVQNGNCEKLFYAIKSKLNKLSHGQFKVYMHSSEKLLGASSSKGLRHDFLVIETPAGRKYLVDPNFRRLSDPSKKEMSKYGRSIFQDGKNGQKMHDELATRGFTEFNNKKASIYLSSLSDGLVKKAKVKDFLFGSFSRPKSNFKKISKAKKKENDLVLTFTTIEGKKEVKGYYIDHGIKPDGSRSVAIRYKIGQDKNGVPIFKVKEVDLDDIDPNSLHFTNVKSKKKEPYKLASTKKDSGPVKSPKDIMYEIEDTSDPQLIALRKSFKRTANEYKKVYEQIANLMKRKRLSSGGQRKLDQLKAKFDELDEKLTAEAKSLFEKQGFEVTMRLNPNGTRTLDLKVNPNRILNQKELEHMAKLANVKPQDILDGGFFKAEELAQLAKIVKSGDKLGGLNFSFTPSIVAGGVKAFYRGSKNEIGIGFEIVSNPRKISGYFLHEADHAYIDSLRRKDELTFYHGRIQIKGNGSLGKDLGAYQGHYYFDELYTYGKRDIKANLQVAKSSKIRIDKLEAYKSGLESRLGSAKEKGVNESIKKQIQKVEAQIFAEQKRLKAAFKRAVLEGSESSIELAKSISNQAKKFKKALKKKKLKIETKPYGNHTEIVLTRGNPPNQVELGFLAYGTDVDIDKQIKDYLDGLNNIANKHKAEAKAAAKLANLVDDGDNLKNIFEIGIDDFLRSKTNVKLSDAKIPKPTTRSAKVSSAKSVKPPSTGPPDKKRFVQSKTPKPERKGPIDFHPNFDQHMNPRYDSRIPANEHQEIKPDSGDKNIMKIHSGLHTQGSLDYFKTLRGDLFTGSEPNVKTVVLPNGVTRVYIPKSGMFSKKKKETLQALKHQPGELERVLKDVLGIDITKPEIWNKYLKKNNKGLTVIKGAEYPVGIKTLFPNSWDRKKIREAAREVWRTGTEKNGPGSSAGNDVYTGVFEGVKITIYVSQGKIKSAFPTWIQ